MEKVVTYPEHVMQGIKKNHRAYPLPSNLRLFGADTETVQGHPHTFQISDGPSPDGENRPCLIYVNDETILPKFWEWLRPRLREGGVNVCYFHNLHFDAMILFASHHLDIYEQGGSTEFFLESDGRKLKKALVLDPTRKVLRVEILFGKVNAATVSEGSHYMEDGSLRFKPVVELKIYDSRAFTQASLARSLKMFLIPQNKLKAPDGLGKLALKTPQFEEYAKQDAVAEWHLGRKILDIHAKYKVRPSISLPQFMARVFRHDFFQPQDEIVFPPLDVVRAAELSYHGGKNGIYCDPGVYEDVTEVDINSAYPWAMRELPSFLKGEYRALDSWAGAGDAEGGPVGVYKVSGWTDPKAKYPLIFDHSFRRVDGDFSDVWVTSYEMARVMKADFIKIKSVSGHVWEGDPSARNPFRGFVEEFYKLKQETPHDDPYYHFYKIALNSLYGKLVGVVEDREIVSLSDGDKDNVEARLDYRWDTALNRYVKTKTENIAGQMYNPFIATLITGRVRALLYDLETKYEAIHSATDSIKTLKKIKAVPGLGGWKEECHGRCWIFRNKLYLHFTDKNPVTHDFKGDGSECETCKLDRAKHIREDGQSLVKYALHAYKGSVKDLFNNRRRLIRDGKMSYEYLHVIGLREGLRRRETPGNFVMRPETLLLKKAGKIATSFRHA